MIAEATALANKAILDANLSPAAKVPENQVPQKSRKLPRILLGFFLSFLVTLGVYLRLDVVAGKPFPTAEKIAYTIPGSAIISLFSPTFIQCFSYSEMFYQERRAKLDFGQKLDSSVAASANSEGVAWGLVQGVVFYIPLLVRQKKHTTKE